MRAGRAPLRQGSLLCRRSVCGRHAHDGQRQAVRAAAGREPPALRGRGSEVGARSPHYENAVLTHTGGEVAVSMGTHGVGGVCRDRTPSHTRSRSARAGQWHLWAHLCARSRTTPRRGRSVRVGGAALPQGPIGHPRPRGPAHSAACSF